MSSTPVGTNASVAPVRVLIVATNTYEVAIRSLLSKHAHSNAISTGAVSLLFRPENLRRFAAENSKEINSFAPRQSAARVVLVGKVEHNETFGTGRDSRSLNTCNDSRSFEVVFPAILKQCGCDWESSIVKRLASWQHDNLDTAHVRLWLDQFRRLGVSWIGRHLLKTLDFWTSSELMASLALTRESVSQFEVIALNLEEQGKSGSFLSNILRKQVVSWSPIVPIVDLSRALNELNSTRIMFIEDTLLTGTEIIYYLSGLLGLPPEPNTEWQVKPLKNPNLLRAAHVEFRFPISTSLGIARLQAFLRRERFVDARIATSEKGRIEVFTNAGEAAFDNNQFFVQGLSNCPVNPDEHLDRMAFRGPWRNESNKVQAETFCWTIGEQLFRKYLHLKNHQFVPGDESKVAAAALGMCSLGLTVATAHSVPKASLPLFWMGGEVNYDGSRLQWMPLFENAAS
jgi:hypothetical protein